MFANEQDYSNISRDPTFGLNNNSNIYHRSSRDNSNIYESNNNYPIYQDQNINNNNMNNNNNINNNNINNNNNDNDNDNNNNNNNDNDNDNDNDIVNYKEKKYCDIHPENLLNYFCVECHKYICSDCLAFRNNNHPSHLILKLSDIDKLLKFVLLNNKLNLKLYLKFLLFYCLILFRKLNVLMRFLKE